MTDETTPSIPMQEAMPPVPPAEADGGWAPPASEPRQLAEAALRDWRDLTAQVREIASRCGLTKTQVASRASMPMGTFSPWYDGTYAGNYSNQAAKIRAFLTAQAEAVAAAQTALAEPEWVDTPTAVKVMTALTFAQQAPGIALITLGSGMGKTTCAKRFAATRPHAYRVVMRPSTASVGAVLREVADTLGVTERDPAKLVREIGSRIRRNGKRSILMIDEAQWLRETAVNELRFFLDEYGCGLALLGNEEVHTRFGSTTPKDSSGQLHRRIGMRIRSLRPSAEDIATYVGAWGLTDPDSLRLLRVIGGKPGALGQVTATLQFASILAAGAGRPITVDDIRAAWLNRGAEEIR